MTRLVDASGSSGGGHPATAKKQCRWARRNGSDGFLLCGHEPEHAGAHHIVTHVFRVEAGGEVYNPWHDEEDAADWYPPFMWEAVVEQEREKLLESWTVREKLKRGTLVTVGGYTLVVTHTDKGKQL